ncbi:MAG TPA: N-acetyl-gamma-glutamyl-phosphate reductase [Dehalococcoidia bacterium]|nr:N-acetyl-gamma-glutamyl-phosphate reductase [Dehalococcoidia bacterium]
MDKAMAGIINVTGYAGIECARLLSSHPQVTLATVTGRSAAGHRLADVFPHLADSNLTIEEKLGEVDIVLVAMPHKESAREVLSLIEKGIKVVDLSADFRLKDETEYNEWYGVSHPAPQLLSQAVYGLTELYRNEIAGAQLVANPGCYPTGAILAMAPAVKQGLIKEYIVVDSKSGVSGAGRSLNIKTHYAEANEDTTAYALEGHRHLPEIIQELGLLQPDKKMRITFVPHLVPMTRGILSTCYAPLAGKITAQELKQIYSDFYSEEPFVKVTDTPPHTKHTRGSNLCLIHPTVDGRTGMMVVISCIDNLIKGAAGQAVQNMNLMLGLPETAGLEAVSVYP